MSLFSQPTLKTKELIVAGIALVFYELSAQARINVFSNEMFKDREEDLSDSEKALKDLEYISLLAASSLKPGRDESVEELQEEIKQQSREVIEEMYKVAAEVSGLAVVAEDDKKKS